MKNDLISRSALKKYVNDHSTHWLNEWDTAGVLLAIANAPAIDPDSLRAKGRWEYLGENYAKCPHCGWVFEMLPTQSTFVENNLYCRHCACKMMEG